MSPQSSMYKWQKIAVQAIGRSPILINFLGWGLGGGRQDLELRQNLPRPPPNRRYDVKFTPTNLIAPLLLYSVFCFLPSVFCLSFSILSSVFCPLFSASLALFCLSVFCFLPSVRRWPIIWVIWIHKNKSVTILSVNFIKIHYHSFK